MALKVGELYASFGIDSSGLNSAISGIEKKCSSIAKGLAVTGAAITASVTRSVVNLGKDIYNTGTEFHAQMSNVSAIAGSTESELEQLTAKALEMGSTTSFTAKDAGEAMEYMAMAGWKTGEMLDGIEAIMDLAAASGENLGTTSDIVTDALTAFGLTAKDSTHFAEVMAATATNANTNVGMMGESFKYVAPLAGTLGYSIDDVAVALGVMANSGIKSSQAGTSLARILNNMIKPTESQAAAMEELGLSLYDSEGNTKSLMQVMEDMRAAAKENGVDMTALADDIAKLDAQLENGEISERQYMDQMTALTGVSQDFMSAVANLAGTRGLSGMLAIMNSSDADFQKLVDAIANCDGALDEMVGKMLDNAQGDMILFKSAVDGLKISLWDLVEGPFRGIVKQGTSLVQTLQGLDKNTQMAGIKMAGLAAAAGPAMTALGGMVGFAGKLVPFLSAMTGPLALVGAGLGLFAVAAVDANNDIGNLLQTLSSKAQTKLRKFNSTIDKSMKAVSNRMPKLIDSVVNSIDTLLPEVMNTAMSIINGFAQTISSNAGKLAEIGKTIFTNIVDGVTRYAPTLIPNAVSALGNIATSLINNLPTYLHSLTELGKSILQGLKNVNWSELGLNLLTAVINAVTGIGGELKALFEDAKTAILEIDWSEASAKISDTFKEAGKVIKQAILGDNYTDESTWSDVGSHIWESIKNGFNGVADFTKMLVLGDDYTPDATWEQAGAKILEAIKGKLGKASDLIKEFVLGNDYTPDASWSTVGTKIWDKVKSGIGKAGELVKGLVLGDEYAVDSSWAQVGSKIWDAIKNGIGKAADLLAGLVLGEDYSPDDSFASVCGKIWDKIKTGISTGIGKGFELLANLTLGEYTPDTSFGDVVGAIWKKVKEKVSDLAGKGFELLAKLTPGDYTPDTSWGNVGQSVWDTIWGGITDISTKLNAKMKEALANLPGFISDLASNAANFLNSGTFAKLGESIIGFLSAGIKSKAGGGAAKIIEAVTGLFDGIDLSEIGTDIFSAVQGLGDFIIKAIVAAIDAVETGATSLITAVGGLMQTAFTPENLKGALGTLSDIGGVVIEVIAAAIKSAQTAAVSIYTAIGNIISGIDFESAGVEIGTFVTGLIDKIAEKIGSFDFETVANALGSLVGKAINGIKSATLGIGQALSNWILSGEVFTTLYNIVKALVSAAWGFFTGLFKEIWDGSWLGGAINEMLYGVDVDLNFDPDVTFTFDDSDLEDKVNYQIITPLQNQIVDYLQGYRTADELKASFTVDAIMELGDLTAEEYDQLEAAGVIDYIEQMISSTLGETPVEVDVPVSATTETTDTIFNADAMAAEAQEAVNTAITTASENAPDLTTCGIETATTLATGISESGDLVDTAMKGVSDIITDAANAIDLYDIGQSVIRGLTNGMNSMVSSLMAKARSIANRLKTTIQSGLQVHSPSRFTMWVGEMLVGGLVNSLDDGLRGVATASRRVAETVRDQMYLSDPSRNTVYTGRQSVMETEQAIVRAASSKALQGDNDSAGQRTVHVTLELNGETIAETFVPIVDETMIAQMAAYSRR